MMRFGVIGCGTVAGYGHIPALAESEEIELVALSDLRKGHLEELGKKFGVTDLYTDYKELLARPDIDAVTVATPVGSHYQVVLDALAAGKHVFCEKPISDVVSQGLEMVEAAEKAGRLLAINFEMRASKVISRMRDIIESGEIGNVRFMRLTYNWVGPRWAGEDRHRLLMTEGKGPIFDCGVHFFDLARWFSGQEFKDVRAAGLYEEKFENPDHVVATCRMHDGAVAVIDESWVFGHTTPVKDRKHIHRIEIEGDDGAIMESENTITVLSPKGNRVEQFPAEGKAFGKMYHMFVESIKAGHLIDLASGEDGVRAVEAAEAALESVVAEDKRIGV